MSDDELHALLPHQQRVVAEKMELDSNIAKLNAFFNTATFHNLSEREKSLQQQQIICQRRLSEILAERIALFKVKP